MRRQSISLELNICEFLDVRDVCVLVPSCWVTQNGTMALYHFFRVTALFVI